MSNSGVKPYVGQTVHYIDTDNDHCAALIVALTEQEVFNEDTKVSTFTCQANLVMWNSYGAHMPREGVHFDATEKKPGHWHFIEIEAEKPSQAVPGASGGTPSAGDSVPKSDTAA